MSRGIPAEVNLTVCVSACLFQLYLLIGCNATTNSFYRLLAAFSWILIRAWICKLKFCSRFMASFTYVVVCLESCVAKSVHTKFQLGQGYTKKHGTSKRERAVLCQSGTNNVMKMNSYMYRICRVLNFWGALRIDVKPRKVCSSNIWNRCLIPLKFRVLWSFESLS